MGTLESIVQEACWNFGLNVTEQNYPLFVNFLERQQQKHHYDLEYVPNGVHAQKPIYRSLLEDKLLFFVYLVREQRVTDMLFNKTLVDSDQKLRLLKAQLGSVAYDRRLSCLYERRRTVREQNHKMPRYREIFDEIGSDPEVVRIWRRRLYYKTDVLGRKGSAPNHRL